MAKYSYFLGQSGGSGGGGDFALIKIEYPVGQPVTVTFNGETIEAPDTSGLWMYGCEETGTYTIAITGTTAEVEVEITTQGQIENVWISPQVINYGLIYHLGNEFTNVDGTDEARYAISTGGWVGENYNGANIMKYSTFKTLLNINTNELDKCFIYGYTDKGTGFKDTFATTALGTAYVSNPDESRNVLQNQMFFSSWSSSATSIFKFGITSVSNFNLPIYVTATGGIPDGASNLVRNQTKNANNLNLYLKGSNWSGETTFNGNFRLYSIGFVKTDDISGLSTYGSDIATILSNATNLFTDVSALNWMVLNCTGDFMISALSNTNFINAMNSSANKSILVANEHWNRFIALLSV